jgi:hypothetical protein
VQGESQRHHGERRADLGQVRTVPARERPLGIATATLTVLLIAACSKSPQVSAGAGDSLNRDLELAPVAANRPLNDAPKPSPGPDARAATPARQPAEKARPPAHRSPQPTMATEHTLPTGSAIQATLRDSINSRRNKVGETVEARVAQDITDPAGQVVIPAGSTVQLTIAELAPAKGKGATDGKLAFQASSVTINGQTYALAAQVQPVRHELRGRGVSAGEVEKVGAGTAIGAIMGRILGGNGRGAVVGGVVGAAGGTAVAVETASRDVVVPAGATVDLTLTNTLVVKAK